MTRLRRRVVAAAAAFLLADIGWPSLAEAASGSGCTIGGTGGQHGVLVYGSCLPVTAGAAATATAPVTKTVVCGSPSSADNAFWNPQCGPPRRCPTGIAYATLTQTGGTWILDTVWCPATTTPTPSPAALHQQALRLLPTVTIGSTWTNHALTNAQTILWANTTTTRTLPTTTILGTNVAIRIHLTHAHWTFGDHTSDTTTTPGHHYDTTHPCTTAQCPDYYGHTYTHTGPVTITLTITWHAQFRLTTTPTSPWTDITPDPLTGPTTTHHLTIEQARGILTP